MTACRTWIYILLMSACLSACVTERVDGPDQGKAFLEKEIDKIIARLPYQTGIDLFKDINHLVSYDRFVIEPMMECLDSPNDKVRSSAALVLGTLRAEESLEKLLTMTEDESKWVRMEVARAVLEIGAWDTIPLLIDGLDDEDERTRELCIHVLRDKTGENFGYVQNAQEQDRCVAVQAWRNWWSRVRTDPTYQGNLAAN